MAELTEELKMEVVQRLARFQPPAEIVRGLKEDYGLECSVQQIVAYDPTRPAFRSGERFIEVFKATRENFIKNTEDVPIANQGYRLQVLQSLLENHLKHKKLPEAARVVEQAAKEMGGLYAAIDKSKPLQPKDEEPAMSEDDRAAQLAKLIDGAMGRLKPNAPGSPARQ